MSHDAQKVVDARDKMSTVLVIIFWQFTSAFPCKFDSLQ